jgi:hypothetical protein
MTGFDRRSGLICHLEGWPLRLTSLTTGASSSKFHELSNNVLIFENNWKAGRTPPAVDLIFIKVPSGTNSEIQFPALVGFAVSSFFSEKTAQVAESWGKIKFQIIIIFMIFWETVELPRSNKPAISRFGGGLSNKIRYLKLSCCCAEIEADAGFSD